MSSNNRRAAARRRAWGRGPIILRFEPLEGRQLLAAESPCPTWSGRRSTPRDDPRLGRQFHATGVIKNQGNGAETGPFQVALYASTNPVLGPESVLLGDGDISPATSKPGEHRARSTRSSACRRRRSPGYSGQPIYITLRVDPRIRSPRATTTTTSGSARASTPPRSRSPSACRRA